MKKYYCFKCSRENGLVTELNWKDLNLTGSDYTLSKYLKHTSETANYSGTNSVYKDAEKYFGYTVSGSYSGSLEIDELGRKNLIWYAGKDTGVRKKDGRFISDDDTVKVVLPEDPDKIHSYSVNSNEYCTAKCESCGGMILKS